MMVMILVLGGRARYSGDPFWRALTHGG